VQELQELQRARRIARAHMSHEATLEQSAAAVAELAERRLLPRRIEDHVRAVAKAASHGRGVERVVDRCGHALGLQREEQLVHEGMAAASPHEPRERESGHGRRHRGCRRAGEQEQKARSGGSGRRGRHGWPREKQLAACTSSARMTTALAPHFSTAAATGAAAAARLTWPIVDVCV
jgi:hypothetical protein